MLKQLERTKHGIGAKRSPVTKLRRFFCLLVCAPLVACSAPNFAVVKQDNISTKPPLVSASGKPTPKNDEKKIRGETCVFDEISDTITFDIHSKPKVTLRLEIPTNVNIKNPLVVVCEKGYTIIVTPEYLVRALGYQEVINGERMLGLFPDGSFFPQNAVVASLKPLGRVSSGFVRGKVVTVCSGRGVYEIDTDSPSEPARVLTFCAKKSPSLP